MSHAKRCDDKGVANEGRGPKTGNRAATGSIHASPLWRSINRHLRDFSTERLSSHAARSEGSAASAVARLNW